MQYHLENRVGLLLDAPFWPKDLGAMPCRTLSSRRASHGRWIPFTGLDPHPTTGMMAMFMAHEMFPDADLLVTGFSFLDDSEQTHGPTTPAAAPRSTGSTGWIWAALLRSWIDDGSAHYLP